MAYIVYINGRKRKIKGQMMLDYYRRREPEVPGYYKVVHLPEKQPNPPAYKTHSTVETYASVLFVFLIFLAILAVLASMVMH